MHAAIDWARSTVLTGDPEEFAPGSLRFLLQECTRVTDAALRTAVEQGLTRALHLVHTDPDPCRRIEWVRLLAEAAAFSDDPRLSEAAVRALPAAVDLLESHVRHSYEPGDGLTGASCEAQLRGAWALLVSYELTGRVPYAMLAEELFRLAMGRWWDEASARFGDGVAATCAGLRVASGLAALHADPDYRAAAIMAPGADPARQARRMAGAIAAHAEAFPRDAGDVGQGLAVWFALESDLQ